jgi:amino acid transporter
VLTLKKPCDSEKCHEGCGIGDEGNIINNILTIGKLAPLFITSAASLFMLLENRYAIIASESDEPLDPNPKTNETMMNWIGYIFAVLGPIFFGMLWDRKRYRLHV